MAKRLLTPEAALRKIEISLALNGKSFKPEYINCRNCKYCWRNIPGGSPTKSWKPRIWNTITQCYNTNPTPKPEKWAWHCFKYSNTPYHAYLRFRVTRINVETKQTVSSSYHFNENHYWTNEPQKDEKDILTLQSSGGRWRYSVCRRFESSPRK